MADSPFSNSFPSVDSSEPPRALAESEQSAQTPPLTYDPGASPCALALYWHSFGFVVLPTLPGSQEPAVDGDRWLQGLSAETIANHWGRYADHEVGFIPGEAVVVLSVHGANASAVLYKLESAAEALPNMALKSSLGTQYVFKVGGGARVTSTKHSGAANGIGVVTGQSLVMLPPSLGVELVMCQAEDASKLTEATQALIDTVSAYNVSTVVLPQVGCADVTEPAVTSAIDATTFLGVGRIEAGKGGEAGNLVRPPTSATPFAAFTTFDGQSSRGLTATLQTAPGDTLPQSDDQPTVRNVLDDTDDDVLTLKAAENPVVAALTARDLYKTPLGSGRHEITCPWAHAHAHGSDPNTTYSEPDDLNSTGRFCCHYPHTEKYTTSDVLEFLGIPKSEARHKSVIRVVPGDLHRVLNAAEKELAKRGRHFQSGGIIVSISTDPTTGDPSIVPTRTQALTRELSVAAIWEKYDGRTHCWVPCDPPARHVSLLHDAQSYAHLPPLAGVTRQPYLRELDGVLITRPGYDSVSKRFGVFDPRQFAFPEPTPDAARAALAMLEDLLSEFRFANETDKAAALSSIFTATVRPSLPHAPAYHVKAAIYGCGKSHLCEVTSLFAGPAPSVKVSYASTSEEATKSIMSLLVSNPAVVEFDDMATDLLPHGIVNRMLTSEQITDRILGYSKTATVTTRTLFLSSGNNVGPVRDLLRRVITINLDPRCATPTTIVYKGKPVDTVRKHRGAYVAAVLTIIQAWRHAGSPRTDVSSIATYGGPWADYCRHPLIWLGLPDPGTSLLAQVQHDPDGNALGALMEAWFSVFGSSPTTVRKVISKAGFGNDDLHDAICEFPVVERGEINPSKLGWLLKKNANRIVGPFEFREAQADGRKAWAVVLVAAPASPPLPASVGQGPRIAASTQAPNTSDVDTLDLY